jgi:uncharacterized protein
MPNLTARALAAPLALVTGASSGIGREIAIELARRGYSTILIARRVARLEALAAELSAHAPSFAVPLDLTDQPALDVTLQGILSRFGPPAVLVNCAGAGIYRAFEQQRQEDLEYLMRLNHEAPLRTLRALLPAMAERAQSAPPHSVRVVTIASQSVWLGAWGHAAYAASKAAMRALASTLTLEHGCGGLFGYGGAQAVRFMTVYPGIIDTEYFKHPQTQALWARARKRAISPQRVARAVGRNLRRAPPELFVPWHYRAINLMQALCPSLGLRLVRWGSMPDGARRDRGEDASRGVGAPIDAAPSAGA